MTAANVVGSAVSDSNTGMTREKREEVAAMVSDDNHVVFSFSSSICISLPYMTSSSVTVQWQAVDCIHA